jgi:hypothetical protein
VQKELEQRSRLEERLRGLGVSLPERWPWDDTGELHNLQLLELCEKREKELREILK